MKNLKTVFFASSLLIFGSSFHALDQGSPSPKPKNPQKQILPESIISKSGIEFRLIRESKFLMGSDARAYKKTNPRFKAEITKPFYMAKFEVTQEQWESLMGNNPSRFSECGGDCPVESVSWNDIQNFIQKINQKEGGEVFRLPTEAEWELEIGRAHV